MIGLYLLIGALALLITVLLFGFAGCNFQPGAGCDVPKLFPTYAEAVEGTSGLVAYWRLGEPDTTPLPSSGGAAKEEIGGHNGDYKVNPSTAADDQRHSPASAGQLFLGVSPGLLEQPNQSNLSCMKTDGGYTEVPWAPELNPQQFTFEAWVQPDPLLDPRYFYCLVESTGPTFPQPRNSGWGLYLGPSDINNPDPAGPLLWQVWMGDGTGFKRVAIANPNFPADSNGNPVSVLTLTYLALTFDGNTGLQLFLYLPNMGQNITHENLQTLESTTIPPMSFKPNDDPSAGKHGDFLIGVGSFLTFNPAPQRLYPFKGKIQEVALYNKSFTDCPGILGTLAGHEVSGGNT